VRYDGRDTQPNALGVLVQIIGIVAVLVGAIVGLGAVVLVAIGGEDDEEEVVVQPSTVDFASGADLAAALGCTNVQAFDGAAHVTADATTAPVPEAFHCTVGDKPVFAYVYVNTDVRSAALDARYVNANLCLSFPSDPAQAPIPFEGVVGSNWLLATREGPFSDELSQRLGGGALRQELSCALTG
jgi:hypothetical protein